MATRLQAEAEGGRTGPIQRPPRRPSPLAQQHPPFHASPATRVHCLPCRTGDVSL